jgi:hypothetical protein
MITNELPAYVPQVAAAGRGRPPRKLLFAMMVAVFASGGVIGSGSTLMVINRRIEDNERHHDPALTSQRIVGELSEKLSLNEEQTAQIEQITQDHLAALDRLRRDDFFPKIREQFKLMEDQVNAVLGDEQRAQYHAWLEEKRQRVCPPGNRHGRGARRGNSSGGVSARNFNKRNAVDGSTAEKKEASSDVGESDKGDRAELPTASGIQRD